MPISKIDTHTKTKTSSPKQHRPRTRSPDPEAQHPTAIIQRARIAPESLTRADVLQLQSTIGNQAVGRLLAEASRLHSAGQKTPVQQQEIEEDEDLLQGKMIETVQHQPEPDEEELLQGKGLTLQAKEEAPPNRTGMPDHLKSGLETLSGMDLSGVRVQYSSSKPKQLNALAYTRGQEIHVAPGQEKHLPHEGWHAVQQMQGRVRPTMQMKGGVDINDDARLEKEANVMGTKALLMSRPEPVETGPTVQATTAVQRLAINPNTYFPGALAGTGHVAPGLAGNKLKGSGLDVNGVTWHTYLIFQPLMTPGVDPLTKIALKPEGSGVYGVMGPDHPMGSKPASVTANENNQLAGNIRRWNPHQHVAAHIANDQLGGPGVAQNLFAFPSVANTLMETQVESKMKTAVQGGFFIYYSAQVNHPTTGPADHITMSWNKLNDSGNDIGGGQTNAVIKNTSVATNVMQASQSGGTPAKNYNLLNAANPSDVYMSPWGPFQMPDPKRAGELETFLDWSKFPAVGKTEAFKRFLENYASSFLNLQRLFLFLDVRLILKYLARDIEVHKINITIKKTRGVTQKHIYDLKSSNYNTQQNAFFNIIKTTDKNLIIKYCATNFANTAKSNALNR